MKPDTRQGEIEEALATIPVIDIHTHLVGGRLGARGLHDVMLYHMLVSDLYGAGCPSGARLTQFPQWPTTRKPTPEFRKPSHSSMTSATPAATGDCEPFWQI